MIRRAAIEKARADGLMQNRHRESPRHALLALSARSLAGGSVDAICRDAVT